MTLLALALVCLLLLALAWSEQRAYRRMRAERERFEASISRDARLRGCDRAREAPHR